MLTTINQDVKGKTVPKSKKADEKKPIQQPIQKPVDDKNKKPVKPKPVNDY